MTVADTETARAMMPGVVTTADGIDAETLFWFGLVIARLQRVVTGPGTGDRYFLHEVRGKRPATLSDKQRAHVMRLAWRYRFQLPAMLRPGADPDKAKENSCVL